MILQLWTIVLQLGAIALMAVGVYGGIVILIILEEVVKDFLVKRGWRKPSIDPRRH